jgi:hypothetical protein
MTLLRLLPREMVSAFLPADQGYALMKAAAAVMTLHGECNQKKISRRASAGRGNLPSLPNPQSEERERERVAVEGGDRGGMNADMLNQAVLADPTGTIFSVPERQLIPPRSFEDEGLGSGLVPRETLHRAPSSSHQHHLSFSESSATGTSFFGEKSASRYSGLDLRKIVVAAYAEGNTADAFVGQTLPGFSRSFLSL